MSDVDSLRQRIHDLQVEYGKREVTQDQIRERLTAEIERLRGLIAHCVCMPPPYGEGPQADCPVHGAIQAYNETAAERDRLRAALTNIADQCPTCTYGARAALDGGAS